MGLLESGSVVFLSCLVLVFESPHWLVVVLVGQAVLLVLVVGGFHNLWLTYVLFLAFLGGLLVVFVYTSGLVPSLSRELRSSEIGLVWFLTTGLLWVQVGETKNSFSLSGSLLEEAQLYITTGVTSSWCAVLYLFVVFYLLFVLYAVCWMLKKAEGPLRQLN